MSDSKRYLEILEEALSLSEDDRVWLINKLLDSVSVEKKSWPYYQMILLVNDTGVYHRDIDLQNGKYYGYR